MSMADELIRLVVGALLIGTLAIIALVTSTIGGTLPTFIALALAVRVGYESGRKPR